MKYLDDDGAIEMWLGQTNTFVGISQNKDVLKAYAKLVSQKLSDEGISTSVGKIQRRQSQLRLANDEIQRIDWRVGSETALTCPGVVEG